MKNKVVTTILGAAALSGAAVAGEVVAPQVVADKGFCACDALKNIGKIYEDKSNPYVQGVKVFGRAQWQYANVEGEGYNEFRRLRSGVEVSFLNYFMVMARANLETGGADNHRFGFDGYDEAQVTFDFGKAFGIDAFDAATLTVGRDKVEIGEDVHTSSKKIKTVERTAITGKIRPENSVGAIVNLQKGDWLGAFGVYSAEEGDTHDIAGEWGSDDFFYASSTFGVKGGSLIVDFVYNTDAEQSSNDYGNKWASSVAYLTKAAGWNWAFNAIVGEAEDTNANRDGSFYGFVVQPSKFIIEDKLEAVGRYYYQGSDSSEGIRANSRYSRTELTNSGRGDAHHSIYAGLNYYLCGDNAKIMTGVEYETLDTPAGDESAATLWSAVRFYF